MSTVYEGVKWGDGVFGTAGGTVTYAFATALDPTYYDYAAQLSAAYQAVVEDAFDQWSSYADIQFVYTTEIASADITLGWDRIDGFDGTLAETLYQFYPSDQLAWAEIRFDVAEDWTLSGEVTSTWETDFYAVALHEIGHAIGLDHTTDLDSIMYEFYGSAFDLTAIDIAGIQALYGTAQSDPPPSDEFMVNAIDFGGWNHGWYRSGGWEFGWHVEAGWDNGWYLDDSSWYSGWFYHEGWEYGWYGTGAWQYGWYYDYGGYGWGGTNTGWLDYGGHGYNGHEGWGWSPTEEPSRFIGSSFDEGGWDHGWYLKGGWGWGWHAEEGWDYGWYETSSGWDYGWFQHEGWEYGWYGTGSWAYGWYYDYGGLGWGWNLGWHA